MPGLLLTIHVILHHEGNIKSLKSGGGGGGGSSELYRYTYFIFTHVQVKSFTHKISPGTGHAAEFMWKIASTNSQTATTKVTQNVCFLKQFRNFALPQGAACSAFLSSGRGAVSAWRAATRHIFCVFARQTLLGLSSGNIGVHHSHLSQDSRNVHVVLSWLFNLQRAVRKQGNDGK